MGTRSPARSTVAPWGGPLLDEPPHPAWQRQGEISPGRWRWVLLVGLAAFLATSLALRQFADALSPPQGSQVLAGKLGAVAADPRIDTLILGTSRVLNGIDPAVMRTRLAAAGTPLRPFNLALAGLTIVEQRIVLARALARARPGQIKLVVLEPWLHELRTGALNVNSPRTIRFHAPRWLPLQFSYIWEGNFPLERQLAASWISTLAGSKNLLGEGRLVRALKQLDHAPPAEPAADYTGFHALDDDPGARPRRQLFLANLAQYRARLGDTPPPARPPGPGQLEVLAEMTGEAREHGARVVLYFPPALDVRGRFREVARLCRDDALGAPCIRHNDPRAFPELYQVASRFDAEHLNRRGAALASARLADGLAALLHGGDGDGG